MDHKEPWAFVELKASPVKKAECGCRMTTLVFEAIDGPHGGETLNDLLKGLYAVHCRTCGMSWLEELPVKPEALRPFRRRRPIMLGMATIYNTNVVPGSHWDTVYQWKNFMKTAGWTVPLSGTGNSGTTGASDLITSATIMATPQAWFVLRDGDGVRSFCFQSGSADHVWRVKYSASAGFTGGAANQMPAATDEVLLVGTGTDGSPGFVSLFAFLAGGSRKVQMIADTAAPWSFFMMSYPAGSGPDTVFMLDGLLGPAAGDPDPVVVAIVYGTDSAGVLQYNTNAFGNIATGDAEPFTYAAWMAKGQAGQRFSRVTPLFYCSGNSGLSLWPANGSSNAGGVNQFSGKDILLPLMWARDVSRTGPGGYKGLSRWLQFNGALRAFSDLLSLSAPGAGDYLHVSQGVVVPWNGVAIV